MYQQEEPLNWRKDPLLVDAEPVPKEQWLTANELIARGRQASFRSSLGQLLLYPIMVRRHDFVQGERLLQAMPYLVLDALWAQKVSKRSLAAAEKCFYYFSGSAADFTIKQWQKKIINYAEGQARIPFPIFRLADHWQAFFANKQAIPFQSARGEGFQLPLYLSQELAYLVGVVMGDGHLADYFINIIDASREHIKKLAQKLAQLFQAKITVYKQPKAAAWNVNLLGKWIVRYVHFLSGQPIAARKYPKLQEPLLVQKQAELRRAFWRGLMDADGTYRSTISFSSASQRLVEDFKRYLHQQAIPSLQDTLTTELGQAFSLRISGSYRQRFAELVGTNHPQKRKDLETLLQRNIRRRISERRLTQKFANKILHWNTNRFITYNGETFFDFSRLANIGVLFAGQSLKKLRGEKTQEELGTLVKLSQSILSFYERDARAIPLAVLQRILQQTSKQELIPFLHQHSLEYFQKKQTTMRLDLQPNEQLLQLLQGLQLRNGYFLIIGLKSLSQKDYLRQLADYFQFLLNSQSKRIYNTILEQFVKEFCLLSDGWTD